MKTEDPKKLVAAAVASVLAAGALSSTAFAADDKAKLEKCYGVAAAGNVMTHRNLHRSGR
jgi:uncharacterized membrane protein